MAAIYISDFGSNRYFSSVSSMYVTRTLGFSYLALYLIY